MERLRQLKPGETAAVALLSFLGSLLAIAYFTGSPILAVIIMSSTALHELSHFAILHYYGKRPRILFLPIMAYNSLPPDTSWARLNMLARVLIVGPICNFTLGLVFLGLGKGWMLPAALNLWLALLNLSPATLTDGGKFVQLVCYHFSEARSKKATILIILTEIIAIAGIIWLMPAGKLPDFMDILVLTFFGLNLLRRALHEGVAKLYKIQIPPPMPEGLTEKEAMIGASVYLGLVTLTLLAITTLPPARDVFQPWLP